MSVQASRLARLGSGFMVGAGVGSLLLWHGVSAT